MDYTGTLLIASPHLEDPNFRMTVIYLAHQTDDKVFGLILNRASSKTVGEFWHSVFSVPCDCDAPLYIGGPMVGPVMGLHRGRNLADPDSDDVFSLMVDRDEIKRRAEEEIAENRVFLGHSGWTTEQLAGEIDGGYWHLLPADDVDLFSDPSDLWLRTLECSTRTSLQCLIRSPELPDNPLNN